VWCHAPAVTNVHPAYYWASAWVVGVGRFVFVLGCRAAKNTAISQALRQMTMTIAMMAMPVPPMFRC
jgi:hypothetical protein